MSVKYAEFKSHNKTLQLTRNGRTVTQHLDRSSVDVVYPTVAAAKWAMENARTSGNLVQPH